MSDFSFSVSVFVPKQLHAWEHEIAFLECLESRPEHRGRLEPGTAPDRSTLRRGRHMRFADVPRETVREAARTVRIKAQNIDIAVPREPERTLPLRGAGVDGSDPDDRAIPDGASRVTGQSAVSSFPRSHSVGAR